MPGIRFEELSESRGGGSGYLILVDIVCHGTPSPMLFKDQLTFLAQKEGSSVTAYEHRSKAMGWAHIERVDFADGSFQQDTRLSNSWRRLFYSNKFLRPSCYQCPFTQTRRVSDLTVADFWGIENTSVSGFKDTAGVSLVLANTEQGKALLKKLNMEVVEASLSEALPKNPMLYRPSTYSGSRAEAWEWYEAHGYASMMHKYRYYPTLIHFHASRCKAWLKRVLSRFI